MSHVLFAGGGTGGHLYPALALAAALKQERPDVEVHFVGAKRGVESQVLPAENQPHTLLPFEPLRRSKVWQNWRLLPSMWASARGLRKLFNEFKPKLVVGTGGYASAPACLYALTRGVPVAVQEQNSHPGLTTRTLGRWARQVHLGFPEAASKIKASNHTQVTALGNPIRKPDPNLNRAECRARFGLRSDSTVILVVGGSQGSRAINEALLAALAAEGRSGVEAAGRNIEILWATGPNNIESVSSRLDAETRQWVHAYGYIHNMPEALAASDVAISRAGAMGTAELMAWGIPSILIPLPTAAADHQAHNARALANAGAALMLEERRLNGATLWEGIMALVGDPATLATMKQAALERARPNAAQEIARRLAELLPKTDMPADD